MLIKQSVNNYMKDQEDNKKILMRNDLSKVLDDNQSNRSKSPNSLKSTTINLHKRSSSIGQKILTTLNNNSNLKTSNEQKGNFSVS